MKKELSMLLFVGLASPLLAAPTPSDPLELPPTLSETPGQSDSANRPTHPKEDLGAVQVKQMPLSEAEEQAMMSLAPNDEDMAKARKDREEGKVPNKVGKRTTIETHRDVSNRVTEIVVTPGSTKIPYTIKNHSERPIETGPGGNSKGTLGTPKFIEFGW